MSLEIVHEPDRARFAARDGGEEVGFLSYLDDGDEVVIEHTIVSPERQGEGIAGELARTALDELGAASRKRLVPECTYAAQYVRKHPEYLNLTQR